ncbi:GntR family transcriptional regulator [Paracoccus aestuarii]|uniref:GntR family transcriptional regulator n=1 Tax=Paracoccus aestuarii TaxID=453842 RepID=A0A419A0N5_9RHOB|nr:GntR family transcriptional regulator [Paracoccus aestuarii]RJL06459.1 GntR family transcriptional regulator [Paracoccus aestuarii]WCQ99351.1 GntR family transcriptional regulator [Paracoccus aestuarii]
MTRPTTHRIRVDLENAIVDGRYQPGDRIDPEAIAAGYGCSRTPVREALQALEASGLVVVQPKRGSFVARLDVRQLMERFELMAELEAFCAALACRRATAEDLDRIAASNAACARAADRDDAEGYYTENTVFHQAIYAASGNGFLRAQATRLQAVLQPYRRRQLQARGRIRRSLDEHRRIEQAIRQGDADLARRLMTDHVLVQGERFRDLAAMVAP